MRQMVQGEKSSINTNQVNIVLVGIGRLTSDLGSWIFKFALSLYILDVTGSSAMFSLILGLSILPGILVNVFAGVAADKFNRKTLIITSDVLSGLSVLAIAFFFVQGESNLVLFSVYSIIISILQAFFQISLSAAIPNIVDKEHVVNANSIIQGISGIVNVLGPVLGAVLYAQYGLYVVLIVDGISFLISALIEVFIRFKPQEKIVKGEKIRESLRKSIAFVKSFQGLSSGVIVMCLINFIMAPLIVLGVTYMSYTVFGLSKQQTGWLQSAYFAGTILGSIAISVFKLAQKLSSNMFNILELSAVPVLMWLILEYVPGASGSSTLVMWIMGSSMFLLGLLIMAFNIPLFSTLQLKIPDDKRGSVFGLLSTGTSAAMPLGIWVYGVLLEIVHWPYIIIAASLLTFLTAFIAKQNVGLRQLVKLEFSTR